MIIREKNPGEIDLQHFAEGDVDFEVVKSFIEANKADPTITEFISSIVPEKPINPDVVKGYLETIEGKSVIQPMFDSFANRAIQSHDEKKKKEIEAEIARKVNEKLMELNKEDTPEQRMIKEQALRMKELEDKYENDKKLSKINEIAYKEGIDPAFVSGLSFDSAEQFALYANNLKNYIKKSNEKAVNDFVATNSVKPGMGKQEEGGDPTKGMTSVQKFEYYKKEAEARENRTA